MASLMALDVVVMCESFPELSETFIANEAAALQRAGHRVEIVARETAARPDHSIAGAIPTSYVLGFPRGTRLRTLAWRMRALAWLIATRPLACAADVVARRRWRREEDVKPLRMIAPVARALAGRPRAHLHAHFAWEAATDAMRLSRLLGRPWSVTAHAYDIYSAPANLAEKLRRSDFATSGCAYTVRDLQRIAGPEAAGRVHEIVMGVDPGAWARTTPLPHGRHVVAVGRLMPKKGFADLVAAAAILRDGDGVDRVTIVGEGPERERLERAIAEAGAGDVVVLAGAKAPAEVRAIMETADVLCMPCVVAPDGDRDSMPVVVKEAMAMEICVVATDEVGLPEIVRPPWGRLAPPHDPAALAAALAEVLAASPAERSAMGAAARAHVAGHANVDVEAAKLAELIAGGSAA
jgi:colanic acid/amylovoran biosynthesis glycosyltransferase